MQEGGGQYYTHIKHVDVLRQRIAVLSHGKVEVTKILAWDQENHLVYYLGKFFFSLLVSIQNLPMVENSNIIYEVLIVKVLLTFCCTYQFDRP